MASFFNISSRFGRGQPKAPTSTTTTSSSKPNSPSDVYPPRLQPPPLSRLQSQTSFSSQVSSSDITPSPVGSVQDLSAQMNTSRKVPFFFKEENTGLIVKGNFMTLAAKPEHIDKAEWLAHQVVEQYRLLDGMIKIVQEVDAKTSLPICNPHTCPTMAAGGYTYTWLDKAKKPIKIPAAQYIHLVQQWILSKINDPALFPTDTNVASSNTSSTAPGTPGTNTPIGAGPTTLPLSLSALSGHNWTGKASGFPENFETDTRNLYRQMFRCYAHLYHGHWVDPFYHINAHKELNTCFIHFVNVGRLFDLLEDRDVVPMQPLIDIWLNKELLATPRNGMMEAQGQAQAGTHGHEQGQAQGYGQAQAYSQEGVVGGYA